MAGRRSRKIPDYLLLCLRAGMQIFVKTLVGAMQFWLVHWMDVAIVGFELHHVFLLLLLGGAHCFLCSWATPALSLSGSSNSFCS